jgi:translation initiation factor 1
MAEVCPTCGLPKDLCVCGEIEKEQQRIRIRLETRKFGKATTIIDGMDDKNSNLQSVAQKLKTFVHWRHPQKWADNASRRPSRPR